MQSAWASQEEDFKRQIDILKKQKHDAMEQNIQLAEQANDNQSTLESHIAELKSKIKDLEVTRMEQDDDDDDAPLEVVNELKRENDEVKEKMAEFQESQSRPAQIMGMSMMVMTIKSYFMLLNW